MFHHCRCILFVVKSWGYTLPRVPRCSLPIYVSVRCAAYIKDGGSELNHEVGATSHINQQRPAIDLLIVSRP